jgi:hypothetical protein
VTHAVRQFSPYPATRDHTQRAASIVLKGPDPTFMESGGADPARGFSTCPAQGPFPYGTPEKYAAGKANLFPTEGGPAIVEIEAPDDLASLAINAGGEIRFEPGFGLEELLKAWPTLAKKAA